MRTTERARLTITTLSAVHIGCDRDYEPTEYVHDKNKENQDEILAFGIEQLINVLSTQDKDKLSVASKANDPLTEVKLAINSFKPKIAVAEGVRHIPYLATNPINLKNKRAPSIRRIERTAFDTLSEQAILPGSSLKGALRTAWINAHPDLLRVSIPQDPMRLLHVADAFATKEARAIMFLQRPHKGPLPSVQPGTPSSVSYDYLLEAIQRRGSFSTEVMLHRQPGADVKEAVPSIKELMQICNNYYRLQLDRTVDYLKGMKGENYAAAWLKYIEKNIYQMTGKAKDAKTGEITEVRTFGGILRDGEGFLLRVGKHGGAESLTLEPPSKKQIKTKYGTKHATHTMTLTMNDVEKPEACEPFGWLFVRVHLQA